MKLKPVTINSVLKSLISLRIMKTDRLFALFLGLDLFFSAIPVMAADRSPLSISSLFIVFGSLLIVLAIIIVIYFIMRGKFKTQRIIPFRINVVNRINIDSKHQIILLKIDDNYLLLGLGNISVLKELDAQNNIDFRAAAEDFKDKDSKIT